MNIGCVNSQLLVSRDATTETVKMLTSFTLRASGISDSRAGISSSPIDGRSWRALDLQIDVDHAVHHNIHIANAPSSLCSPCIGEQVLS